MKQGQKGSAAEFLASRAFISAVEIRGLTGDSHSGFYKKLRDGKFPAPALRDGPRYTRWKASDVAEYLRDPQAWLAARSSVNTLAPAATSEVAS
jgi:predicted DNA-binding transcriptional regulator AlpA